MGAGKVAQWLGGLDVLKEDPGFGSQHSDGSLTIICKSGSKGSDTFSDHGYCMMDALNVQIKNTLTHIYFYKKELGVFLYPED